MEHAPIDTREPVFVGGQPHWLRAEVMRRLGKDRTTLWRWAKRKKITQRYYLGWACYPVAEVVQIETAQQDKEHSNGSN
ncbi:hypothetical protein B0I28_109139 [Glycomyces artemisiae]|uniref:Helix-turn-helix protein n=2 Tax=Glycomyces artemisiae TaxID=1076443 RepID=A0A2T0UEX7_9ACTN|nr:hypothetical protein B0I28_109139 [Glycomyces artemisiae]